MRFKTRKLAFIVAVVLLIFSFAMLAGTTRSQSPKPPTAGYQLIKKAHIGGKGFWDYMAIDEHARRLFITHNTKLEVVNADTGEIVGAVEDAKMNAVHGVAVVPELGKGFISNGATNTVTIFNLKTLKPEGTVVTGTHPDALIYDPASQQIFAFNGGGDNVTVIKAATGDVAGTVALEGGPEFAASDDGGTVYVNIEEKDEVVAIDSRSLKVTHRYPTAPCHQPAGMAIDTQHARLFLGCHNKLLGVMDTKNGKIVATPAIGNGVDANRFDAGTQTVFSSNGEGTLSVIHEDAPDKYTVLQNVQTEPGARTMELDPQTHKVYLIAADLQESKPTPENPRNHHTVVPDTMRLLIYGK
jgi:DNA-binding beta-propeller fold protein YncE